MKSLSLNFVWNLRIKLRAEGAKLRAEGAKLWAEGDKLWAEGSKLWAEAVIEVHGNVMIEWTRSGCTVEGVKYQDAKGGAE